MIKSWGMEYPTFSFSYCFDSGHFENVSGEGVHPKMFLLKLLIIILWAVSLQKI